jgi:Ca2+-transporting ATPase
VEGKAVAPLGVEAVFPALRTRPAGLAADEARARLAEHGPNALPPPRRAPAALRLAAQLTHFMALLLWGAGALAFVARMPELGWAILAVVLLNGAFGFWQERRAGRALDALEALVPRRVRAVRGGREVDVGAEELVPGDVVALEEGDRVPADARLVWAERLRLDLSLLTGESAPVERGADPDPSGRGPADATCLVPSGATVLEGRGRAVVHATGRATELGRIAGLATATARVPSRLEHEVRRLVRIVTLIALVMGGAVFALVRVLGAGPYESALFAIGIVVANVPEGLLPAITITLAVNVQRMARRRALVRRLSAVETLGAVEVICTDKTGTLTQNRLAVRALWRWEAQDEVLAEAPPPAAARPLLAAAALCTNARRGPGPSRGAPDATERALLEAGEAAGLDVEALRAAAAREGELPFDPARRRMTVVLAASPAELGGGAVAVTKGAPVEVLERCVAVRGEAGDVPLDAAARARVLGAHDALAARGLRMLAVAVRAGEGLGALAPDALEAGLVLLGLVGMEDPPRPGVREALGACRRAGITVTLVTGDHGLTARALAREVGLDDAAARLVDGGELERMDEGALARLLEGGGVGFARVVPEQKLRLVRAWQRLGKVVAVTGDGVNDAPALHAAHVGVAMGEGGTDVAREAADVVLLDDDFATLVAAIEEGRATWANVRKFLAYVFTSNVPEIAPFLAMMLLGIPPALTILLILAIDLGTDMLPALALGAEPPEPGLMDRPPRRRARRLLDTPLLVRAYGVLGVAEGILSIAAFLAAWSLQGVPLAALRAALPALLAGTAPEALAAAQRVAVTAAFAAIVCCQIGNVLACRSETIPATALHRPRGRLLAAGLALEVAILAAVVYAPPLQGVFGTAPLPAAAWPALAACAPAMVGVDLAWKRVTRALALRRRGAPRAGRPGAPGGGGRP